MKQGEQKNVRAKGAAARPGAHTGQDRAQQYLDIAGVIIVALDADQRVTLINQKGCAVLDRPQEQILGLNWFDEFVPVHCRLQVRSTFAALMRGEMEPMEYFDNPVVNRGGEERLIAWHNTLLRDAAGRIVGTLSSGEDVTEHRRAERALSESEERYRRIVELANEGVWLVNAQSLTTFVNKSMADMLGYTVSEMTGRPAPAFMHADEVADHQLRMLARQRGLHDVYERRFRHKDGSIVWGLISTRPLLDAQGAFAGALGMVTNISERKRAEQALCESEQRFRSIVEASPMGMHMYELRPDGRLVFIAANPAAERMLDLQHEELLGRTIEDAFPALVDTEVPERYRRAAAEGVAWQAQEWKHVQGQTAGYFDVYAFQTSPGKMVTMFLDITARKRAEEDRKHLELQMQHVQKLESLGLLAGGIAHDFNNVLMAILGNADLALMDLPPTSPAQPYLKEIVTASRRATGLCQQMLAYSGKGRFTIELIDLNEAVLEMTHMLEISISKKAALKYNLAQHLSLVEADATQVRQVLMNLITNASEAIGERGGVISISTGAMECDAAYLEEAYLASGLPQGIYVYLEVADTGCGMNAETKARMFDPFFTTKFTGRGLGMAAALGIVRGHRGAIKVYTEEGKGTTIKMLLPASGKAPVEQPARPYAAVARQAGGTILVAEDEGAVRILATRMLEKLGFTVLAAADGRQALDLYRAHQREIVCVLLDLTMPHLDGEEAFREIRRLDKDARVIITSGYNEQDVTQRFVGKGMAGFIQKPFQLAALEAKLHEILG